MFQRYFHSFINWFRPKVVTHTFQHIVGIREVSFTKDETLTLRQFAWLQKKVLKNKLAVVNAFMYNGTEKDFYRMKGKIEALEELLAYYSKLEAEELQEAKIIPISWAHY